MISSCLMWMQARLPDQPCAELEAKAGSMKCVERIPEYMDGLVLVSLLRARHIDAQLFDENFVRQNWFEILAFGGFRIMVPASNLQAARENLAEFRGGALLVDDDEMDRSICPACDARAGRFDHRQRRWVFLACLVHQVVLALLLMFMVDGWIPYFVLISSFSLATLIPCLLRYVVNNRLRCAQCSHAWRELPRLSFSQQQRDAEAALATAGS
jgi:hypothetical protein